MENVEKRNPTHRTKELVLILNKRMVAVKVDRHCFTAPPEILGLSAVNAELKFSTHAKMPLCKPLEKVWRSRWPQLGLLPVSTCLVS